MREARRRQSHGSHACGSLMACDCVCLFEALSSIYHISAHLTDTCTAGRSREADGGRMVAIQRDITCVRVFLCVTMGVAVWFAIPFNSRGPYHFDSFGFCACVVRDSSTLCFGLIKVQQRSTSRFPYTHTHTSLT